MAVKAKEGQIGVITGLKTSCLAAGRADLAAQLALELRAALDQLKHGTEPNQEIIQKIREEVPQAAWLKLKEVERVRDLPPSTTHLRNADLFALHFGLPLCCPRHTIACQTRLAGHRNDRNLV